ETERQALTARLSPPPAPIELPTEDQPKPLNREPQSNPRRRFQTSAMIVTALVLLLAASGGVAYFTWDSFFRSVVNKGTGNEDPPAYIPSDSTVIVRLNSELLTTDASVGYQFEQRIRSLGSSPLFTDCEHATGMELKDFFSQVTLGVQLLPHHWREPRRAHSV